MNRQDAETLARNLARNTHAPVALCREMESADAEKDNWYAKKTAASGAVTLEKGWHRLVAFYMPDGSRQG